MKILIKSAKIIDEKSQFHQKVKDIFIENGKVAKIEEGILSEADQTLEFNNLHISKGWFDSSIAFGEPGMEERETLENGLKTAAKSGFTDILLNPLARPAIDAQADVEFLKSRSRPGLTQLHPMACLTKSGSGKQLTEFFEMKKSGAKAFGDFKKPLADANLMKIALQYAQNFGGLVCSFPLNFETAKNGQVHEQNKSLEMGLPGIPVLAESLQISRDLHLLEYTGGKLHIPTISTRAGLELIKEAKQNGLDVSCSVAIYNLFFIDEMIKDFDSKYKLLPPLRSENDRQALINGLADGTIDMVTSDHLPVDVEQKKREFEHAAFGSIGLESAFSALNKIMGVSKSIELLTLGRKRFDIEEPKFKVGEEANFSMFDPEEETSFEINNIYSHSKNSLFLGEKLTGKVLGSIRGNKMELND